MRIGEVSERTGIPTRMLRYYEEQGLLASSRTPNGYRAYDDAAVDRALRVRGMIQSGLSTRVVRVILDIEGLCEGEAVLECSREFAQQMAAELATIEERLSCLTKSRDAVLTYLERTRHDRSVYHLNTLAGHS
jgi:DNA-binding transcriptional MerR regulator